MNKNLLPILGLFVFSCSGTAQKNKYSEILHAECPNAEVLDIEENEGFVEIEFLCNGEKMEIGIKDNSIFYRETDMPLEGEVMDKIKGKILKEFPGWFLDDVSLITRSDSAFLQVEIERNGMEQNLYFTKEGKKYRESDDLEEDWDFTVVNKGAEYNFQKPDKIYILPDELLEISGTTLVDDNTVLCIQDELGAIFEFSLKEEELKTIYRFTDVGDFEDLTLVNNQVHILRSDGTIFQHNYKSAKPAVKQYKVPVKALDNEGLFYDPTTQKIFLSNKIATAGGPEDERKIIFYSPENPTEPEEYLNIRISDLEKMLPKSNKRKILNFNPSAIAFHPGSGELYVLSADDRFIAVYSNKELRAVYPLPKNIYYKPEGISFLSNGDMLLSSEGKKKSDTGGMLMVLKKQ